MRRAAPRIFLTTRDTPALCAGAASCTAPKFVICSTWDAQRGGLVWDFAIRGHLSVGIEGSDFSLRERSRRVAHDSDRLFTRPTLSRWSFALYDGSRAVRVLFNVITAVGVVLSIYRRFYLVGATIQLGRQSEWRWDDRVFDCHLRRQG